jgi:hypothetical protein
MAVNLSSRVKMLVSEQQHQQAYGRFESTRFHLKCEVSTVMCSVAGRPTPREPLYFALPFVRPQKGAFIRLRNLLLC